MISMNIPKKTPAQLPVFCLLAMIFISGCLVRVPPPSKNLDKITLLRHKCSDLMTEEKDYKAAYDVSEELL